MNTIIWIVLIVVCAALAFFGGMAYRKKVAEGEIGGAEQQARNIVNEAIKNAENKKREILPKIFL